MILKRVITVLVLGILLVIGGACATSGSSARIDNPDPYRSTSSPTTLESPDFWTK